MSIQVVNLISDWNSNIMIIIFFMFKVTWMNHIKEAKESYMEKQKIRQSSFKENRAPRAPVSRGERQSRSPRRTRAINLLKQSHAKSRSMDAVFLWLFTVCVVGRNVLKWVLWKLCYDSLEGMSDVGISGILQLITMRVVLCDINPRWPGLNGPKSVYNWFERKKQQNSWCHLNITISGKDCYGRANAFTYGIYRMTRLN